MEVGQQDHCLHQLRQRPGLRGFQEFLHVVLGDEPGSVCQDFVDLVEVLELLGRVLDALQPHRVAVVEEEVLLVQLD